MNVEQARTQMIEQQVRAWNVLNPDVLNVMSAVHREAFVPAQYRQLAFADTAIPLACGQHMMIPSLEGRMLQSIAIRPGDQVLEVGTGSGYTAACMAALGGAVTSMEIHQELADRAAATLDEQRYATVTVQSGDALEISAEKRYDVVAVTGGLANRHTGFEKALRIGGRLFVVIGTGAAMEALLILRESETEWSVESLFETQLAMLENARVPEPFVF